MKDVLKNETLKQQLGTDLYGKFNLFVAAIRAEINPADYGVAAAEDVVCFNEDYCFCSNWTRKDGTVFLRFNERAGGNCCGDYAFIDGLWIDVEGGQVWNSETGDFSEGYPERFIMDLEEDAV